VDGEWTRLRSLPTGTQGEPAPIKLTLTRAFWIFEMKFEILEDQSTESCSSRVHVNIT